MTRAAFYAALRKPSSDVFGGPLSNSQVEGMEAILDECQGAGCDLRQTAYVLATAYGETGGRMQPLRENMNYSARRIAEIFSETRRQGLSPAALAGKPKLLANTVYGGEWGRRNLGNTEPDDGWNFRGAGLGQITGRANFRKWGDRLDIPLLMRPQMLEDLETSVRALVRPMMEGWATGKKLPDFVNDRRADYLGARAVWGGVEPSKYVRFALAFEAALRAGGLSASPSVPPDTTPVTEPQSPGFLTAILNAILALFGVKK